ncbi:MAG: hypothetical protein U1E27_11090 [Kiritimatiellia bacterium]|nr:hypothetical protein [Kiritimatiellia bacterium]
MLRLIKLALILFVVFSMTGCEDNPFGVSYKFQNRSGFRVTVSPNGQTGWNGFIIDPGQDHSVKITDSKIYFTYSPSNKVRVQDDNDSNKTVFVNR